MDFFSLLNTKIIYYARLFAIFCLPLPTSDATPHGIAYNK